MRPETVDVEADTHIHHRRLPPTGSEVQQVILHDSPEQLQAVSKGLIYSRFPVLRFSRCSESFQDPSQYLRTLYGAGMALEQFKCYDHSLIPPYIDRERPLKNKGILGFGNSIAPSNVFIVLGSSISADRWNRIDTNTPDSLDFECRMSGLVTA